MHILLVLVQTVHHLNIGRIVWLTLAGAALLITSILLIVFRNRLRGGEMDDDDEDDDDESELMTCLLGPISILVIARNL